MARSDSQAVKQVQCKVGFAANTVSAINRQRATPSPKRYHKRLTQQMRSMPVGQWMELDRKPALAFYSWLRRNGRKPELKKSGKKFLVGRSK